jgi:hypothetical protein
MSQQFGEDPNSFGAVGATTGDAFTTTGDAFNNATVPAVANTVTSPTTSATSAVIVDRPPISGDSSVGKTK